MPSSVLLALVVAAGVLVLMPALAHRYDTALRGQDELRASSMRVLPRERRRRTVPAGGPVRPPATALTVPAAVRTAQGISPSGGQRDLAAVQAALVRRVMQEASADLVGSPDTSSGPAIRLAGGPSGGAQTATRTRVRVRRPAVGDQRSGAIPIPVSAAPVSSRPPVSRSVSAPAVGRSVSDLAGSRSVSAPAVGRSVSGLAGSRPVSVVPATRSTPAVVPAAAIRRVAAEAQRARRRRLVLLLALLVGAQFVAGVVAGPAFLLGAGTSALAAVGLLARLRAATARHERRQAQERHTQALVARARQHRAEAFVRRALRQVPAGVEREAWLGVDAVRQAAVWLASARVERDRPARNVVRVLAAAGREVYPAADGTWAVRPVVRPAARTRIAAGATPAARREARAADAALPKAVNG